MLDLGFGFRSRPNVQTGTGFDLVAMTVAHGSFWTLSPRTVVWAEGYPESRAGRRLPYGFPSEAGVSRLQGPGGPCRGCQAWEPRRTTPLPLSHDETHATSEIWDCPNPGLSHDSHCEHSTSKHIHHHHHHHNVHHDKLTHLAQLRPSAPAPASVSADASASSAPPRRQREGEGCVCRRTRCRTLSAAPGGQEPRTHAGKERERAIAG